MSCRNRWKEEETKLLIINKTISPTGHYKTLARKIATFSRCFRMETSITSDACQSHKEKGFVILSLQRKL